MIHTDNRKALSQGVLKRVDDFRLHVTGPKEGAMRLRIRVDRCEDKEFVLRAADNDMDVLSKWMGNIVKKEHGVAPLSHGQRIEYHVSEIPESLVEPTIRFLDELFPSPIGLLTLVPESGEPLQCVVKIKHFLNSLYLHLLTGGNPDTLWSSFGIACATDWYPFTPEGKVDYRGMKEQYYHYNKVHSTLLEWYLCSSESYKEAKPEFHLYRFIGEVICMWEDWGCMFWCDGIGVGGDTEVLVGEYDIDLSSVEGLLEWECGFRELPMEDDLPLDYDYGTPICAETKEWIIRGYRLAQQVRQQMPLNAALIYEHSSDVSWFTPEGKRDAGHVIFNPRLLLKKRDR